MTTRPSDNMPCDELLLEDLGRVQWAAARLHHGVRDRHGKLLGELSDKLFNTTLGGAIKSLRNEAASLGQIDIVEWCDDIGTPATEARNGVVHSIVFTADDRKQAIRGSTPTRPERYLSDTILDVADQLVEASRSLPEGVTGPVQFAPKTGYGSAHDLPSFVEMRQQLKAFRAITIVMRSKRVEVKDLEKQMNEIADRVDAFYELLGDRHWTFNDWMSAKTVDAILDSTSDPEEAERLLIEMYQDAEATKWHLLRLRNFDGLRERERLLVRAREDYDAGRFDACTLILISVMDGFINDFETGKRKGLAARDISEMVAWDSVTGHHMGLTNALKPFLKTIKRRIDDEVFDIHRHGVVHGSVVNYNNVVVATKAWNLLHATVDWSIATKKKVADDEKPPQPGWRETLGMVAEHGRKKKAREEFVPWTIQSSSADFGDNDVVQAAGQFIEAWQNGRWALVVPFMPHQLLGDKHPSDAIVYTKGWFERHTIEDIEIDRVEYTQSSVAEVRGTATIDGTTGLLLLRFVYYDDGGDLALNDDDGSWRLAIVAPHTYLVDEDGNRLK